MNMALINCPECNRQISDKAITCPHCGFPLAHNKLNNAKLNNINKTSYDIVLVSIQINGDNKIKVVRFLRDTKNLSLSEAVNLFNILPQKLFHNLSEYEANKVKDTLTNLGCEIEILTSTQNSISDNKKITNYYKNKAIIKCPHCGSTAITTGQQGFSLITGFLGSNKTVNRCGKCGYSWQPK